MLSLIDYFKAYHRLAFVNDLLVGSLWKRLPFNTITRHTTTASNGFFHIRARINHRTSRRSRYSYRNGVSHHH